MEANTTTQSTAAMSNEVEEKFEDALCEEGKFARQWTLWEHYDKPPIRSGNSKDDYKNQMAKVCWFNDIMSFALAYSKAPHADFRNIFYDDATNKCRL